MYRVISQTGQGFKAHDRHFHSMRSAWGLRPAPSSFVHVRGDARDGYNTLYLTIAYSSMADTNARWMLLPAFAGSKQCLSRHLQAQQGVRWGVRHTCGVGLKYATARSRGGAALVLGSGFGGWGERDGQEAEGAAPLAGSISRGEGVPVVHVRPRVGRTSRVGRRGVRRVGARGRPLR